MSDELWEMDITYCVNDCAGCYRAKRPVGICTMADLSDSDECPKNRYISAYDIPCDEWKDNEVLEYTRADIALAWVVRCYECKHWEDCKRKGWKYYDWCSHGERDIRREERGWTI